MNSKICKVVNWTLQSLKGPVHCFSMQIVMNKCFLLNPENKFGADPSYRFLEKHKKLTFNSEK